jgi:hypothetical protein
VPDRTVWPRALGSFLSSSLDALVAIVERIFVIGIAVFVGWLLVALVLGSTPVAETRAARVLILFNDHWKALLILLVPLFFRTIRGFIEEVQEFAGMRKDTAAPQPRPNPASRPVEDAESVGK